MPRRRYYKRHNKDKYSVEHTSIRTNTTDLWEEVPAVADSALSYQTTHTIVESTDLQGMRKVKHLTITASNAGLTSTNPLYYVLAYVPQGYDPQKIYMPSPGVALDTYSANQYVMSCGWLDFDGGPLRIRSRLSRNLNSGDSIVLILASYFNNANIYYVLDCTYAITLQ